MRNKSRRDEVLLPVRFNDGKDIPDEVLGEAVNEIVEEFGAVTLLQRNRPGALAARGDALPRRPRSPGGRCSGHGEEPEMDESLQGAMERAP
jgi:hypothetical protein